MKKNETYWVAVLGSEIRFGQPPSINHRFRLSSGFTMATEAKRFFESD